MGRSRRKPRQKMDPRKFESAEVSKKAKKEEDWSFDEFARSKPRRR